MHKKVINKILLFTIIFQLLYIITNAQPVPSLEENIDFLVTFSKDADSTYGDDDHIQIHFVVIPTNISHSIHIKVFDPNIGGFHDQINESFNSKTKFSIYGGREAYSNKDAQSINPENNYLSGIMLKSKIFDNSPEFDNRWYTFGPFNPQEGEFSKKHNAYIFKIVVEGLEGDDGNMYRYFISSSLIQLKPVESANCFTYELCFRPKNIKNEVAHLFPFIKKNTTSIKQYNFDYDNEGNIRLTSINKKSHHLKSSGDGTWDFSKHAITQKEINTSLDIHFISSEEFANDITFYITNKNNQVLPIFSAPKNGFPKYQYKINVIHEYK